LTAYFEDWGEPGIGSGDYVWVEVWDSSWTTKFENWYGYLGGGNIQVHKVKD